jgi:hypothetical protein
MDLKCTIRLLNKLNNVKNNIEGDAKYDIHNRNF